MQQNVLRLLFIVSWFERIQKTVREPFTPKLLDHEMLSFGDEWSNT